jgi:hypothetical protein
MYNSVPRMPTREAFLWFKQNFHREINAAIADTPFSLDMLAAIAAQETGHIWGSLRNKIKLDELVAICVGDTIDAPGRAAFPKNKAALLAVSRGDEMFQVGRDALVSMAKHVPSFAAMASKPDKFCHGYGVFQYDIQFFKTDPDYFLEKRWHDFNLSLAKCIQELNSAMRRMGIAGQQTLTDLEKVHVAIAYNAGTFKPAKGLKQGHQSGGKFYGEMIFDFLKLSQTVSIPTIPAVIPAPGPGTAPVAPPTPVTASGQIFEVDVEDQPLRLRSEPKISKPDATANVIARLPDGHLVRLVSGKRADKFLEVETSLHGAHFRGFAASEFLKPVDDAADIPVVTPETTPPTTGIVAVLAPRRNGSVTKRTAIAGAHSLNETNQPGRKGTTPQELRTELAAIVDYLKVDKPSHLRYQPRDGATFCNIYVHDFCHLAGAYIPRVWWTPDAIERLAQGLTVEPRLGSTIDEQRANDLFRWLNAFGARFGWRQTSTLTKLQTEVNAGALGLIVARRKIDGKSGHIVMVVPETDVEVAKRDAAGQVIAPLQSQAGRENFRYGFGKPNWWKGEDFAESAFWIHA